MLLNRPDDPPKLPLSMGDPYLHLIHSFLGLRKSAPSKRYLDLFRQHTDTQTDKHIDRPRYFVSRRIYLLLRYSLISY